MKKIYIKPYDIILILLCFLCSVSILVKDELKYTLMFLFPLGFLLYYFIYFKNIPKEEKTPFKVVFCILIFVRYVIMSFLICLVGYSTWCINIPDESTYVVAEVIMLIEIMAVLLISIINLKSKKKVEKRRNIV